MQNSQRAITPPTYEEYLQAWDIPLAHDFLTATEVSSDPWHIRNINNSPTIASQYPQLVSPAPVQAATSISNARNLEAPYLHRPAQAQPWDTQRVVGAIARLPLSVESNGLTSSADKPRTSIDQAPLSSPRPISTSSGDDQPKRHRCAFPNCTRTFSRQADAARHHRQVHQNKRVNCLICSADFQRPYQLTKHERENHTIDKLEPRKAKPSRPTRTSSRARRFPTTRSLDLPPFPPSEV
ncbi:hypothetical protein PUNSTDRAFT_139119 [Punctularia strigosozonata HHB-11173 SS5]|uniref:C2H2-type domain-containing protein n=1 Tax=Punctularia strigosozonata (strain HHB-11173) TaxID=741275 RepID=R7S1T3_PUNST|nr:uncharacterized protein PUNSTDRAFT_139119 [Punctularia strigosozonata HHB-11173 SS5]EIN03814.1 hypothetical protein PUNSTDRAFT_139119 [Punctularia strigosozonata HHB-11173 SS5]